MLFSCSINNRPFKAVTLKHPFSKTSNVSVTLEAPYVLPRLMSDIFENVWKATLNILTLADDKYALFAKKY